MLLIQTALEQEFRAATSLLNNRTALPANADSRRIAIGSIGRHRCCVLKTGIGQRATRRALIETLALIGSPTLLLSVGFAGALASHLAVGEKFLIRQVQLVGREPKSLKSALDRLSPPYSHATGHALLVTVDQPALTPASKVRLAAESTALLCDMETHAVATVAEAYKLPWLGARIVSDSAQETLEEWILQLPGLMEDGKWTMLARQIGTHPQDLPGLLRLGYRVRTLQRQLSQFILELVVNVVES